MKPTIDLLELSEFPETVKEAFLKTWDEPSIEFFDNGWECRRCGARVRRYRIEVHKIWHKNLSFGMFLLHNFVLDHMKTHEALGEAFPEIVSLLESALGGEGEA